MAVSEWGNPAADYVLIREPMIVSAFTALFDRAYARGLPIVGDAQEADSDLRLVRLLGLGLKDESIARYLGCSLRTVRRRVAHLMDVHGAQTRFQLGVAAAREDLVAVPPRGA
jgi:DNA-binding NarL/FixJ family response regulator